MILLDLRRHFSAHTFASIAFFYHFLCDRATFPAMPRIGKNCDPLTREPKAEKTPVLTAGDLCALRDFVNKRLAEPPAPQNPSTPSLSDLIEQSPDVYRSVVDLLSQGHSIQAVSSATGVDLAVVKAASWFVPDYRQICKNATARNLALANLRMSEILAERTDSLPADRVPFVLAVSVEKAELLGGGITQRTETRQVVSREELQRLFDQLPRAKARVVQDVKISNPSLDSPPRKLGSPSQ